MAIPLIGMAARALASGGGRAAVGQAVGQAAGQAAGGLVNKLEDLANPLTATTNAFGMLSRTMGQMEAPFKQAEAFFAHVGTYVKSFSPIKFEFFQRAVADFEAAIGKQLIPILDAGTRIFRKFGDLVVQNSAKLQPFVNAVASFVERLADVFMNFIKEISELPGLLTLTNLGLDVFVTSMKYMAKFLSAAVSNPASGLGLLVQGARLLGGGSAKPGEGSARGMAYQQTTTESVTAMMSRIQQSAFGYSGGPAEQTAEATTGLLTYFTGGDFARQMAQLLGEAMSGAAGRGASGLAERAVGAAYGREAGQAAGQGFDNFRNDPLGFLRQAMVNQYMPAS